MEKFFKQRYKYLNGRLGQIEARLRAGRGGRVKTLQRKSAVLYRLDELTKIYAAYNTL